MTKRKNKTPNEVIDKVKKWNQKMRDNGFVQVRVWVPEGQQDAVKLQAAAMRADWAESPAG